MVTWRVALHSQLRQRGHVRLERFWSGQRQIVGNRGFAERGLTSKSTWFLPDKNDPDPRRPAGYERIVTTETVIRLCEQGHLSEAVESLRLLVHTNCRISLSLFYTVLKRCVAKKDLVLGRRVHDLSVKKGYESDTFLCNHILRMYASHGRLREAMDVFNMVAKPDTFTWSSIISMHAKHGQARQAIKLYHEMRRSNVKADGHVFIGALQACARAGDLGTGRQVHADLLASGVDSDLFVCSCLVDMYAKCGSLKDAQGVFDELGEKDVVTWTALISGYSQEGKGHEALHLYDAMQEEGIASPNSVTFVCLLQACASVGPLALEKGKHLHVQIGERGLQDDVFVANSLVNMYAKCGSLQDAQVVFDRLAQKDVVTWNVMIAAYSQQGMGQEALLLYSKMQKEGNTAPDSVTFLSLLQACASVGAPCLEKGKQLHAEIRGGGLHVDIFVASSLVHMYARCGSLDDAQGVFDGLDHKTVVTWNAMIAGYHQQGMGQKALDLYIAMQQEGNASPDSVTFLCLLQACATVGSPALEQGRQLHAQIGEQGLLADVFVSSSLVNMYAKCGSLEDAHAVFDRLVQKDVVTWNALIGGYSQQGLGEEALDLYCAMQEDGVAAPDSVTFACLLQACANVGASALDKGMQLHAEIEDQGLEGDVFVANSLVNMYAKCGSLLEAKRVFDRLAQKDIVTWNALITGYSQQGMGQETLNLYSSMQEDGTPAPNAVTFLCLLQTCASVAALHWGKQVHAEIETRGLQADLFVAIGLINMYAKCGSMVDAQKAFDALLERDVVAWNALIAGYSRQGDSQVVLDLFRRMKEDYIQPNGITFLSVLTVCSHAGLVDIGQEYFESMKRDYLITPTTEHYTCMVDLLGRAGQLDEALAMVKTIPELPDAAVWHALLGACCKWSNVEVGRHAFDEAVKLDGTNAAVYVSMSNIYSGAQMGEEADQMHVRRKETGAWKRPGQSWWTDMDGLVHTFVVGDIQHPESDGIYARLKYLVPKMKNEGYVPRLDSSQGSSR